MMNFSRFVSKENIYRKSFIIDYLGSVLTCHFSSSNNISSIKNRTAATSSPSVVANKNNEKTDNETSTEIAKVTKPRRRKQILKMDKREYEKYAIGVEKLPYVDRKGEIQTVYKHLLPDDYKGTQADTLAFLSSDINLKPTFLRRWWASLGTELEIKNQSYDQNRNQALGNDLAAAHFIVFRKGKVKFLGHREWVKTYRIDQQNNEDEHEDDLPALSPEVCALPTKFDPNFRVEGIDASDIKLFYEGLQNFENLHYIKWLSLRNSPLIDDWCINRLVCNFYESLEYIDLSGCQKITQNGLAALSKMKNLKTLVVEDLPNIKNLEIVCAQLEDLLPELICIGVDYSKKLEELRKENDEFERKIKEDLLKLEQTTITVEPRAVEESKSRNT